jgi:plasmid stability protein
MEREMVDILVRNVDDDIAKRLREKSAQTGKSLSDTAQEALRLYVKPSKAELIAEARRIRAMSPPSPDSTALIREDRDNDEPYR